MLERWHEVQKERWKKGMLERWDEVKKGMMEERNTGKMYFDFLLG